MKAKLKIGVTAIIVLIAIVGSSFTMNRMMTKKISYVDLTTLYNEFELKKELEVNLAKVKDGRQALLDSLELELNLFSKKIGAERITDNNVLYDFEAKKNNYLLKKKQFEEDTYAMQQDYSAKVNAQLNKYVQDYAAENNIDMLLGAEGSGTLMYAKGDYDITKPVLEYINKKYKGGAK